MPMSNSRLPEIWSALHEGDYCTYRMNYARDVDACIDEILKIIENRDWVMDRLREKIVDLEAERERNKTLGEGSG